MPDVTVLTSTMHFTETRPADPGTTPVVFLHGNPSSSHTWRNVLPVVGHGRLLAPDLIGMGRSGKPDLAYTFADHARYLDGWFDAVLGDEPAVLVGHDWGGALAIDRAARFPDSVRGTALFEAVLRPVRPEHLSPQARARSELIASPEGEVMFLDHDTALRQAYTFGVLTPVTDEDLAPYLAPYPSRESRRPLLAWARQLAEPPAELVGRLEQAGSWLKASGDVPKLLLTFENSATLLIDERSIAWAREHLASVEIEGLGPAGHHATEDRSAEIGRAVGAWLDRHALR
ncbi:haloalkane dehalogenase [Agromyces sp. ISL-38]|uniref:haloalkane dehalogenase n=1 Tax=Agromyces sp. ISL-38 TaxID=2819107 RepID=UPI001BE969B2|nr:haloalkane dehalogenase [Agromyces sp. ISL-38]MBT2499368.1 haloalkane dehalogenase [Agromyces sp. ISL-38]